MAACLPKRLRQWYEPMEIEEDLRPCPEDNVARGRKKKDPRCNTDANAHKRYMWKLC